MKCDDFLSMIDAYIDGELSGDALAEMQSHAASCADCRAQMKAAELLRDALSDFDDDLTVPIGVQAAWRRAVRNESRKTNLRRHMRGICAVAAALVVVLGCVLMFNNDRFADQRILDEGGENIMMIAADGDLAESAALPESYSAVRKYAVEDIEAADQLIRNLSAEYEASHVEQYAVGEDAAYAVKLPMDYQEDFLNALSILGDELDAQVLENEAESAYIRIDLIVK